MKKTLLIILGIPLILVLSGCNLFIGGEPTALPSPTNIPSPTLIAIVATPTATQGVVWPTETVSMPVPTAIPTTPFVPVPTSPGVVILPGVASGPYAVVLVEPDDNLNIRSGPGINNPVVDSFAYNASAVMRTGPYASVAGSTWVEVQKPGGGVGWVNARYLSETVAPATFCTLGSVTNLLNSLDIALTTGDGLQLAALVSPTHGMTVHLWRYGSGITFMQNDARWMFISTYEHNWGAGPASGLDTIGSFHISVLPWLQEVFNASYTLTCNSLGSAPVYGTSPWYPRYTNINYYTVYKPGTPGVDLDFRYFQVGVEFVSGQPYVFALVHTAWEP